MILMPFLILAPTQVRHHYHRNLKPAARVLHGRVIKWWRGLEVQSAIGLLPDPVYGPRARVPPQVRVRTGQRTPKTSRRAEQTRLSITQQEARRMAEDIAALEQ